MKWSSIAIAVVLLLMLRSAHADTQASIGELSAAEGSQLGVGTSLYVRIDYHSDAPLTVKTLNARAEHWRPWRGYAVMHLWNAAADRKPARKL